jgi:hypothetical protein
MQKPLDKDGEAHNRTDPYHNQYDIPIGIVLKYSVYARNAY